MMRLISFATMTLKEIISSFQAEVDLIYDKSESVAITRLVIEHVFGSDYQTSNTVIVNVSQETLIHQYLERLRNYEPIQYILGQAWFCNHIYKVNSSVLIPRPETEELILLMKQNLKSEHVGSIIEIGTGSGCIAIELSLLFPKSLVKATDISAEAINVAIKNASDLGASVTFVNESVFDSGTETLQSKVDIIVSNPPYIAQHEAKEMHPNVLKWEPHTALFVKEHPLEFYITIAALATKILNENGYVFLELNPTYANQIAQCFKDKGFNKVEIIKDISGKERFLKVQ